jgi:hypothetical protein
MLNLNATEIKKIVDKKGSRLEIYEQLSNILKVSLSDLLHKEYLLGRLRIMTEDEIQQIISTTETNHDFLDSITKIQPRAFQKNREKIIKNQDEEISTVKQPSKYIEYLKVKESFVNTLHNAKRRKDMQTINLNKISKIKRKFIEFRTVFFKTAKMLLNKNPTDFYYNEHGTWFDILDLVQIVTMDAAPQVSMSNCEVDSSLLTYVNISDKEVNKILKRVFSPDYIKTNFRDFNINNTYTIIYIKKKEVLLIANNETGHISVLNTTDKTTNIKTLLYHELILRPIENKVIVADVKHRLMLQNYDTILNTSDDEDLLLRYYNENLQNLDQIITLLDELPVRFLNAAL